MTIDQNVVFPNFWLQKYLCGVRIHFEWKQLINSFGGFPSRLSLFDVFLSVMRARPETREPDLHCFVQSLNEKLCSSKKTDAKINKFALNISGLLQSPRTTSQLRLRGWTCFCVNFYCDLTTFSTFPAWWLIFFHEKNSFNCILKS